MSGACKAREGQGSTLGEGRGKESERDTKDTKNLCLACPACPGGRQMREKVKKDTQDTMLQNIQPSQTYKHMLICEYACLCKRISRNIPTSRVTADTRLTRTLRKTVSLWKINHTRKKGNYYDRAQLKRTSQTKFINPAKLRQHLSRALFVRYDLSPAFRIALSLPGWTRNPCKATHVIMITACSQDMHAHP